MRLPFSILVLLLLFAGTGIARADVTIIQRESVRYEYAKVLRVTPVMQTLTASASEERCDGESDRSGVTREVGVVRKALHERGRRNCRAVPVGRVFQRPIAYDVDYTYRGAQYRSRLAEDPGHRLRIRVSVMPSP